MNLNSQNRSTSRISTSFRKQTSTYLETIRITQNPKKISLLPMPLLFLISLLIACTSTHRDESIPKFVEFYDLPVEEYHPLVFVPNDGFYNLPNQQETTPFLYSLNYIIQLKTILHKVSIGS